MQSGFHFFDWLVLVIYFVGITTMGLWLARRIKSSDSYFRGERKFRWWIMVGQAFGTGTHAENPVAQTGATFQYGFATIWYQWKNMLITPFYWLLSPWYRRSERTTIGEMLEDRYGPNIGLMYSIFAVTFFVFSQ
jgi:SSS family solute:Na+ symporter